MSKGSISMKALAAMLAGSMLAIGCGSTAGGHERVPPQSRQAVRAQAAPTLAGGVSFVLALRPNGEVWGWGDNQSGQLGNGTLTRPASPVKVQGLPAGTPSVAIAAGFYHSLALLSDGSLWAWGNNGNGRLGDGTMITRRYPVQVQVQGLPARTPPVAIAAGYYHSLTLLSNGTVWTWGGNSLGQLGDGTTVTERLVPAQVTGLSNVVAIAASYHHSLAVRADGTVWAWGSNTNGQLGDGTTTHRFAPVQVQGLPAVTPETPELRVVDVAAGYSYSLALLANGTVWGWGDNLFSQIGSGAGISLTAKQVSQISGVTFLAASPSNNHNHSIALKSDGTVWTWGHNAAGQLGNGVSSCPWTTYYQTSTPLQTINLTGITSVTTSSVNSLAQDANGDVWVWGTDSWGLWGDGDPNSGGCTPTPRKVPGLP